MAGHFLDPGRYRAGHAGGTVHDSRDTARLPAQPGILRPRTDGLRELVRHRRLLGYAGTGGFLYAGMFAYVAGTPFIHQLYHVPARLYGLLFGLGIIDIMAANILNSRLVPRFGYDRMLLVGTVIAAASAIVTAVATRSGWGGLWGLVAPLFLFASTTGFVVANSITGALADFPERAGTMYRH